MSLVDVIYYRMRDDTEDVPEMKGESEVTKFYGGLSCLITEGTDLFGKCLLEKLLRDCPEIVKLYVLIRPKKDQDFQDLCNELYADTVFDALRQANPGFAEKIAPIRGDPREPRLGLSEEDYGAVAESTQVIFHNGGSTGPGERLGPSLRANVLGTRELLELARGCRRLRAFVLVSTAFSGGGAERIVEERFHGSPAELRRVEDMIAADTETVGLSEESARMLLGDWTSVYAFGKAVAEDLVRQAAPTSGFACCVFRPGVVISSYKEPSRGWCDDKNGPASFFVKIAMGAIHVVHNVDYPCEVVPADMAVNAMLVCTWDATERWQIEPEAFVYNYGSSQEKPITLKQIKEKMSEDPNVFLTSKSMRTPYVIFVSNIILYFVLRILLDYVPALIIDAMRIVHGSTPQDCSQVRESMGELCRLNRFVKVNWRVRMPETLKVIQRLNPRDRELFFCDVRALDWAEYFDTFWRGIRRHVLRDERPIEGGAGRRCACRCPCHCPCSKCPVVNAAILIALAALGYYLIVKILF